MARRVGTAALAALTMLLLWAPLADSRPPTCKPAGRWACETPTPRPTTVPTPIPTVVPTPVPGDRIDGASIYHKRIADLDLAVAADLDMVRIVNWIDDSSDPFDAGRWALVDSLVSGAQSRGLDVLLDLSTYRNHLLNRGINPYTTDWKPLLNFVDARYDSSEVQMLSLAGEVEAPNGGASNRPTTTQLNTFFATAGAHWRSISSIPVQSGGLLHYGWDSGIDWRTIFGSLGICSVHIYSEGDFTALPTLQSWCDERGYPFWIEEFGRPISVGDSVRAAYFDRVYKLAADAHLFWNLGPETNSGSHDVNQSHPLTWARVRQN